MRNIIPLLLTLLLFIAIGYFLFFKTQDQPTPDISAPPLEIIDDTPPLIVIKEALPAATSDALIKQDADIFVDRLNKPQNIPIIISHAQGEFVRFDSEIILLHDGNTTNNNGGEQAPTTLQIQDIIQNTDINANDLFYLHHVTEQDQQGLWGIIQHALVEKFRAGLSLEGLSQNRDALQVIIPADADERLTNGLSSFLGKLLSHKVHSSYIYNLDTQLIGRNPNLIQPGQQLVLIKFSPEELKSVYQYFAEQRQHAVQTYGIPD